MKRYRLVHFSGAALALVGLWTAFVVLPSAAQELYSEEGDIASSSGGWPSGVTRNEFQAICDIPESQGADGWVVRLPDSFAAGGAPTAVYGDSPSGVHDLDVFFYDVTCSEIDAIATSAPDEQGTIPKSTTWVLIDGFTAIELHFCYVAGATAPCPVPEGGGGGDASPSPSPTGPAASPTPTASPSPRGTIKASIRAEPPTAAYRRERFLLSGAVKPDPACERPFHVTVLKQVQGSDTQKIVASNIPVSSSNEWQLERYARFNMSFFAVADDAAGCERPFSEPAPVSVRVVIKRLRTRDSCPDRPKSVTGLVQPRRRDTDVFLEKRRDGNWARVDRNKLNRQSRFRLSPPTCEGTYRVVWPSQPRNERGVSKPFTLR